VRSTQDKQIIGTIAVLLDNKNKLDMIKKLDDFSKAFNSGLLAENGFEDIITVCKEHLENSYKTVKEAMPRVNPDSVDIIDALNRVDSNLLAACNQNLNPQPAINHDNNENNVNSPSLDDEEAVADMLINFSNEINETAFPVPNDCKEYSPIEFYNIAKRHSGKDRFSFATTAESRSSLFYSSCPMNDIGLRGKCDWLQPHCAFGCDLNKQNMATKIMCSNHFNWSSAQACLQRMKTRGENLTHKKRTIVAHLFEVCYDLLLSAESNVSNSPGYESIINQNGRGKL